jgi:hypothetical protein
MLEEFGVAPPSAAGYQYLYQQQNLKLKKDTPVTFAMI